MRVCLILVIVALATIANTTDLFEKWMNRMGARGIYLSKIFPCASIDQIEKILNLIQTNQVSITSITYEILNRKTGVWDEIDEVHAFDIIQGYVGHSSEVLQAGITVRFDSGATEIIPLIINIENGECVLKVFDDTNEPDAGMRENSRSISGFEHDKKDQDKMEKPFFGRPW